MIRPALILVAAVALAGCDPLDRLVGKSPGRDYAERMAVLTMLDTAPPVASHDDALGETQIAMLLADEPEAATPVVQECWPQYLVRRCGPFGEALPWEIEE